jgi:hypothetical protein
MSLLPHCVDNCFVEFWFSVFSLPYGVESVGDGIVFECEVAVSRFPSRAEFEEITWYVESGVENWEAL